MGGGVGGGQEESEGVPPPQRKGEEARLAAQDRWCCRWVASTPPHPPTNMKVTLFSHSNDKKKLHLVHQTETETL